MDRHFPKASGAVLPKDPSPKLQPDKLQPDKLQPHSEDFTGLAVIGWREWLGLPGLGIETIKAKVDTGARTSALHAYAITNFTRHKKPWVRFKVHPLQHNNAVVNEAEAPVVETRQIRDSGGRVTLRPVILTKITVGNLSWDIELTLIDRSAMGFRMLLGREALKNHLLVHPGKSYLLGAQPPTQDKGNQQ